jgi:hypothetical protein
MKWEEGDRIRLVSTTDVWTRLQPGDLGTVIKTEEGHDAGGFYEIIHVNWDGGSMLAMIPGSGDIIEHA